MHGVEFALLLNALGSDLLKFNLLYIRKCNALCTNEIAASSHYYFKRVLWLCRRDLRTTLSMRCKLYGSKRKG